jgi:hypothetical protein
VIDPKQCEINHKGKRILVDTGASDNMCSEKFAKENGEMIDHAPVIYEQMDGSKIESLGWTWWRTKIGGQDMLVEMAVLKEMGTYEVVLGMGWLRQWGAEVSFKENTITINEQQETLARKACKAQAKRMEDNVLKRKFESLKDKTWKDTVPLQYHEYGEAFEEPWEEGKLPEHSEDDFKIKLKEGWKTWKGYKPKRTMEQKEEEKKIVEDALRRGWIEKCYDAAVYVATVFAWKKDGSKRWCGDYKALNENYIGAEYPIQDAKEAITAAAHIDEEEKRKGNLGKKIWTTFDIAKAFHRVRVEEESKKYTAFESDGQIYQWNVMPFGAKDAPAVWNRYCARRMEGIPREWCRIYMDDIIIWAYDSEEMDRRIRQVLEKCIEGNMQLSWKKCEWNKEEVLYLGFLINNDGVQVDPDKVKLIKEYPEPKNKKEVTALRAFMQYLREHLKDHHSLMEPIYKMARKGQDFKWEKDHQERFDRMKEEGVKAIGQFKWEEEKTPEERRPLWIETDSSNVAWAAVFYQKDVSGDRVLLGFASGIWPEVQQRWPPRERELRAVLNGLERAGVMAHGRYVNILTDHRSLVYFTQQRTITPKLCRWRQEIDEFGHDKGGESMIRIQYTPGEELGIDGATRTTGTSGDGRYEGRLLERKHFSGEAWKDITRLSAQCIATAGTVLTTTVWA